MMPRRSPCRGRMPFKIFSVHRHQSRQLVPPHRHCQKAQPSTQIQQKTFVDLLGGAAWQGTLRMHAANECCRCALNHSGCCCRSPCSAGLRLQTCLCSLPQVCSFDHYPQGRTWLPLLDLHAPPSLVSLQMISQQTFPNRVRQRCPAGSACGLFWLAHPVEGCLWHDA